MMKSDLKIEQSDIKALSDIAYEKIKEAIISGQLAPYDRISERKLAEEMGISTSPIKQALNRLRYEGLTEIKPRKGTFVSPFFSTSIEEISYIRAYLEGLAARFAAMKVTEQDIRELSAQIQKMEQASAKGDLRSMVNSNTEFHVLIRKYSRNQYIDQLIEIVRSIDHSIRQRALGDKDEAGRGFSEHRGIYEAVIDRNPDLAEERMKLHIMRTAQFVVSGLKKK